MTMRFISSIAANKWLIRSRHIVLCVLIDWLINWWIDDAGDNAAAFNDDDDELMTTSRGRWFDSRSGRYQVVSTWMGDCLRTGKPSLYITSTKVNSAFHPSGLSESSQVPTCMVGVMAVRVHLYRVVSNTVWFHRWRTVRLRWGGFPRRAIPFNHFNQSACRYRSARCIAVCPALVASSLGRASAWRSCCYRQQQTAQQQNNNTTTPVCCNIKHHHDHHQRAPAALMHETRCLRRHSTPDDDHPAVHRRPPRTTWAGRRRRGRLRHWSACTTTSTTTAAFRPATAPSTPPTPAVSRRWNVERFVFFSVMLVLVSSCLHGRHEQNWNSHAMLFYAVWGSVGGHYIYIYHKQNRMRLLVLILHAM